MNALEEHLRGTDPQYGAKKLLLVPILRPIFRHVPPANWKPLFEQAYARLQVPTAASSEEQRELQEARKALKTLEDKLITQDPDYAAKKALLVPVLQPLFEQIPPSKWLASFEEAYAGIRLPAASTVPPEGGDKLTRDAEPKPLHWSIITRIEKECGAYWTKEMEKSNRVYVENEMGRILPDLRWKAYNDILTERQYREIVSAAWMMAKDLFYALHRNAGTAVQNERPNVFWDHQGWNFKNNSLSFLFVGDRRCGYAIGKGELAISAADYLKRPEIRTNHFDWLYLDSMICCELEVLAEKGKPAETRAVPGQREVHSLWCPHAQARRANLAKQMRREAEHARILFLRTGDADGVPWTRPSLLKAHARLCSGPGASRPASSRQRQPDGTLQFSTLGGIVMTMPCRHR